MKNTLIGVTACVALVLLGCSGEETVTKIVCPDGSTDGDSDSDSDTDSPWVSIIYPGDGEEAPNPVTFEFDGGGGVVSVAFFADDEWPLQDDPVPVGQGALTYEFSEVNYPRDISLIGYDADGEVVAEDQVSFIPLDLSCLIGPQPGFNEYTVRVINDWTMYPKDGTYPYCWGEPWCGDMWGQIHDGYYGDELLFDGGGDCFCSGHTLEIFLAAYRLWLFDHDLDESVLFEYGGDVLTVDSVDIGDFYQWWQGFGVASYASSADAFETVGIGENIYEENWDEVLAGDYVNLSRSTGSGHAVIFINWIEEDGQKVGLRYYGCNNSGSSCPDPEDPDNTTGNSGPAFITEYFEGEGGTVLPAWLFIGRVFLPTN